MGQARFNPAQAHSTLGLHLADTTSIPLLSSASPTSSTSKDACQHEALTALTATFLSAADITSRMGYGPPRCLIVRTANDGPVLVQSFLGQSSSTFSRGSDGVHEHEEVDRPRDRWHVLDEAKSLLRRPPPTFVTTVVGPKGEDLKEVVNTLGELERLRKEVQVAWVGRRTREYSESASTE